MFLSKNNNELVIVKQLDLTLVQKYKQGSKPITNFCINEGTIWSQGGGQSTDQICIYSNNRIFFLEAEWNTG